MNARMKRARKNKRELPLAVVSLQNGAPGYYCCLPVHSMTAGEMRSVFVFEINKMTSNLFNMTP